ncbi:MAG: Ricin lectin [Amycolatopsis sp.]|nr:Ricin lectin [Amycolatopsis sp.]
MRTFERKSRLLTITLLGSVLTVLVTQAAVAAPPSKAGPPASARTASPSDAPDFGPNVKIFDPSMSSSDIQSQLDSISNQQQGNEFGGDRYAVMFKPGTYNNDVNVGYYTQALGLGLNPDDVTINGGVHVQDQNGGALVNFWRGAENFAVNPSGGTDTWAVSQSSPMRRVDIHGDLQLSDSGYSSGGFLADSNVTGQVRSGSQQQWLSRNTSWGSWDGSNWNMVFVGAQNAPAQSFPNPPDTTVDQTPVVREKPFLYVDGSGNYQVFAPSVRTNTAGTTWGSGTAPGKSLPISQFYIAKPADTADTINSALASGKNLLFTPGVYHLSSEIHVTRPDTVVLGLGLATLTPDNGNAAMKVDDVNGVEIAGLLLDAGQTNSPVLLEVGPSGSGADHSGDPTTLSDVFFRVGGAGVGKVSQAAVINSNNVITDDTWIWRADHGDGVGWNDNTADNGLVVNGDNVTAYGLAVEHFQQYQVIWNGNDGRTYFFQNEMPYDVPDQGTWRGGGNGYAAYKVADTVTNHQAWGLGSYCYFSTNPSVVADRAFEVPNTPGVSLHGLVTVSLGGTGTITNIINDTGGSVNSGNTVADLSNYP